MINKSGSFNNIRIDCPEFYIDKIVDLLNEIDG